MVIRRRFVSIARNLKPFGSRSPFHFGDSYAFRVLVVDDEPLARAGVKPFDDARFELALERAKANIRTCKSSSGRFVLRETGRVTIVEVAAADWIEAQDYYACIHVGQKTHLLRNSLNELALELDPAVFCRIHRSTIVNVGCVAGLRLAAAGEYDVLLANGVELRLSRTYRQRLQTMLGR